MKTIIEMAREAGLEEMWDLTPRFIGRLESLVELVRADEREACAGLAERRMLTDGNKNQKIGHTHACKVIAEAIRARGNT